MLDFSLFLNRNNVILIVPMHLRLVFQKTVFKSGYIRVHFWQKPYETWSIPTIYSTVLHTVLPYYMIIFVILYINIILLFC